MAKKVIVFDLDGVICEEIKPYRKAKVRKEVKEKLNQLAKDNKIIIYTSRRKKDEKLTKQWLKENKIQYHKLVLGKPKGDLYVDDKGIGVEEWLKQFCVIQED